MKHFVSNDFKMSKGTFLDFVMFLEKCKGFEEDAKRFIFLTCDTENLDYSYELLRPMFIRSIKNKTGNDILKLFEQFRKNIKLNKADQKVLSNEEKSEKLKLKKRQYYDGLLNDLISSKAFALAQIVYSEKMREKFEVTLKD